MRVMILKRNIYEHLNRCKQNSSTVSEKAVTASKKKASPMVFYLCYNLYRAMDAEGLGRKLLLNPPWQFLEKP